MFSARILWAVKILLVLHKASEAGTPLMKGRELQAACVGPDADTYIYRRTLRELAAKTDYLICVFQSGRTFYQWNPNHRPTLYDLICRLDGGMHEVSHTFWTYENTRTMQPLQKVCKEYDNLIQTYLSENHTMEEIKKVVKKAVPTFVEAEEKNKKIINYKQELEKIEARQMQEHESIPKEA